MNSEEMNFDDVIALATSYCNMGLICKDEKSQEKLSIGQNYLYKSLQLLKGKELDYRAVLIVMRTYVQMYYIDVLDSQEYNEYLYKAIDLYLKYTMKDEFIEPSAIYSIRLDQEDKDRSNSMITLWRFFSNTISSSYTMFYLQLQDYNFDFIKTMHNLLMNHWTIAVKDPLNIGLRWVAATSELGQYFFYNSRFTEARNSLAAAEYMLGTICQNELYKLREDKARFNYYLEDFLSTSQYNSEIWGLYGSRLLQLSIKNLLYPQHSRQKKTCKADESELVSSIMSKKSAKLLLFINLEEDIKPIIDRMTDTYVSNLRDAKVIFHYSILSLTLNKCDHRRMTEECILFVKYYMSTVYKYFVFFEVDRNEQMKLYREQIEILQEVYDGNCKVPNDILRVASYELVTVYARLISMLLENAAFDEEIKFEEITKFLNHSITCYKSLLF